MFSEAEVSVNMAPSEWANSSPFSRDTCRFSTKSALLPTTTSAVCVCVCACACACACVCVREVKRDSTHEHRQEMERERGSQTFHKTQGREGGRPA